MYHHVIHIQYQHDGAVEYKRVASEIFEPDAIEERFTVKTLTAFGQRKDKTAVCVHVYKQD